MAKKRIVVAGAGPAGIEAALKLKKKVKGEAQVIVISKDPLSFYSPSLGRLFRGRKKRQIAVQLDPMLGARGIKFIRDTITSIDLAKKKVKLRNKSEKFDFLLLALGAKADYRGVRGMPEHSLKYMQPEDVEKIKKQIKEVLSKDKSEKGRTIVVIGGGPAGVELVSDLNNYLEECCSSLDVRRIDIKLFLVEALPEVMGLFPAKLRSLVATQLSRMGVDIRTNTEVVQAGSDHVKLKGGSSIDTKTIIWCGGIRPNPVLKDSGLKLDKEGGAMVNSYLQCSEATVYAVGDCADHASIDYDHPDLSTFDSSLRQARIAAHNIASNITGSKKKELKVRPTPLVLGLGTDDVIFSYGKLILKGKLAKTIREFREWLWFKRHR